MDIEQQLQLNWEDNFEMELQEAVSDLARWRRKEELRLAQMAKLKWQVDGNRNSKFFHVALPTKEEKKC